MLPRMLAGPSACICSRSRSSILPLASTSSFQRTFAPRSQLAPLRLSSSSAPSTPSYAHEDLLSKSPARPPRPRTRASPQDKLPFFSQSFLAADNVPEEPLLPPSTSPLVPLSMPIPTPLPSTLLANGFPNPAIRWRPKPLTTVNDDLELYKTLAKARLSAFVVLTAMAGYAMCPVDPTATTAAMDAFAQSLSSTLPAGTPLDSLSSLSTSQSLPPPSSNNLTISILVPTTVGVTLCASSAAALNELIEAPYDAQMARTRNRPVPKRVLSPLHAATFGFATGAVGVGTLYAVNPLCATLGLATILLYCPLYTIAKRHSVYNTWLGAVLGAIPPLIGWAACTSSIMPTTDLGSYALFLLMFFWQFPHFMSLSHTLKSSYASSGYRMLAVLDPAKNALVSMRYALAMIPLSFAFPWLGLTNAWFPYLALAPNGLMAWASVRFWRNRSDRRAKELFWTSLVHLPVVLGLAMVCKEGLRWPWSAVEEEEGLEKQAVEGEVASSAA
ncbi:protoheme IX farnesyltransferase [Pseudohyphozyma bogoriensis]|nr:protoheme IX farnesyltransferase [Pseudohyphozyma bogoriensis]